MIVKQICTDGSNSPDIYWGLSTDTKPTENIKNPSFFKEKDTSKEYVFNEDTQQWKELIGEINGDKLVEVTYGVTTYDEVKAIVDSGKIPYINETEGLYFISRVLEASIRFAVVFNNTTYQIGVDVDNNWSKFTSVSENVSNKANTILPTSTTNYPSSKAVADYVAQHSGGWTLLWQNANPSSEFRAQTLNFSSASSKFNTVVIEYINYDYAYRPVLTKFHYRLSSGFDLVEDTLVKNIDITTQNITLYSRKMYVASGSTGTNVSIHFEDSYKHTITFANDNSMVSEKLNSSLIPLFIYGVN